jgi:signal transduction histidine kinase
MVERTQVHDLTKSPNVAQWLRGQEQKIVPVWIRGVQQEDTAVQRGPRTRQLESAQLIRFFDGLVSAVDHGHVSDLDPAIQTLVTNRLGQGYTLTDFLRIGESLKNAIWEAASRSLPTARALEAVTTLEPVFAHSTTRLAWLSSRAAEAQLEEELALTRHTLAKLDRTKSDFIKIAAHELKTPLTLIRGYTAILATEMNDQHDHKDILRGLTNGITRLHALIQNMIDVSIIDDNVLALSLHPTSLNEVVSLAVKDLQLESAGRHLAIQIERFPPEVKGMYLDAKRIYQVFTNLVGNAIKFTPDDGRIEIKAQVLKDPQPSLAFVEVSIADTGIGIDPDDLPHIFNKFYRVGESELHSTSKTQYKGGGPGLGLPIAKGIIEAHGGRIWAESPGQDESQCPGSTFHIMLPIHKRAPESISERFLRLDEKNGLDVDMPPDNRAPREHGAKPSGTVIGL